MRLSMKPLVQETESCLWITQSVHFWYSKLHKSGDDGGAANWLTHILFVITRLVAIGADSLSEQLLRSKELEPRWEQVEGQEL